MPELRKIFPPRIRTPVQVHYGNDEDFPILNGVNDTIRKTMGATATKCCIERLPRLWPAGYAADGFANFSKKVMAKAADAIFVIACCFPQLLLGGRQQVEFHFPSSASRSLRAASPWSDLMAPVRNAFKRS